ncbi:MAG: hypothetical protein WCK73_06690 [Deltaproteobacteria bacterium]
MRLPLLAISHGHTQAWLPTTIRALGKNEEFLEGLIGKAPELLGLEDLRTHVKGPYAAFHQLEVETPLGNVIAPDIVFLTQSGHVIVVEVKLADNQGLKGRDVVAQVVDYAASIARYTEEELTVLFDRDLPVGARFSDLVRKHLPTCPAPSQLAAEVVRKIRAAEIHLVVACDEAPEGLRDFVASVTAQQALGNYELRVCELTPFIGPSGMVGDVFLVPTEMVRTEVVARTVVEVTGVHADGQRVSARVTPQDEVQANMAAVSGVAAVPQPQIAGAVGAYSRMMEPNTRMTGSNPTFRFVVVSGWPSTFHYEFMHRKTRNELGAELHFESDADDGRRAAAAVRDAKLIATPEMPELVWDQDWQKGRGRIRALFTSDTDPEIVARAMVSLIRMTRGIVDKALRR